GETQTAGEDLAPTAAPSTTTPSGRSRRHRLPQAEPDSGPCRPDRRDRHNGGGTRLEGSGTDRTGWENPGPKGPHHQDQRASAPCGQGARVRELILPTGRWGPLTFPGCRKAGSPPGGRSPEEERGRVLRLMAVRRTRR